MTARLCLMTPPELVSGGVVLADFQKEFGLALSAGDVASVLLRIGDGEAAAVLEAIEALRPLAQDAGAAFLLEQDAELAVRLHCDGVQVSADPKLIKQIRSRHGDEVIIGADCGTSRHAAMLAGEAGCDYVSLSTEAPDAIAWWAELMEVPCIAAGGITLENAPEFTALGAEFLAVEEAVWRHPQGPARAIEAFNALLGTN